MIPYNKIEVKKGLSFGRLTLTGGSFIRNGLTMVEAICICGIVRNYLYANLRRGNTTSCGCRQKECAAASSFKHGLTSGNNHHPLYHVYSSMKGRCYNKNNSSYPDYGLRGIKVCDEWLKSFMSFFNWAILNGWQKGLTIERKQNDGMYEPNNCRFATQKEQQRNKRTTLILNAFGENKCLTDWAADSRCVMSLNGVWLRIKKGWNPELAITTPSLNIKAA